jgi:NADPH:quinone reductase-like Zn-dependent oxidoreductase
MRALGVLKPGKAENLVFFDVPTPKVEDEDDIVVKVRAVGLNGGDGVRIRGFTRVFDGGRYVYFALLFYHICFSFTHLILQIVELFLIPLHISMRSCPSKGKTRSLQCITIFWRTVYFYFYYY